MQERTIHVNGYDMTYVECGWGEPLLLVHGSLSDYRIWSLQMESFSRHYRTIAVSLRHFYPERWDGEGDDFSLGQHAADLHAFVKALEIDPVHLMAHSRGGDVALLFATGHPHLLRSVILIDPAPLDTMLPGTPDVVSETDRRKAVVLEALDHMVRGDVDSGLELFVDGVTVPGNWARLHESVKQMRRENAWSLKSLLADAQASIDCEDVGRIDVPVLFVTAEYSPAFYGVMIAALRLCLQDQKKATISNASHGMFVEQPEVFNTAVLDFLSKVKR